MASEIKPVMYNTKTQSEKKGKHGLKDNIQNNSKKIHIEFSIIKHESCYSKRHQLYINEVYALLMILWQSTIRVSTLPNEVNSFSVTPLNISANYIASYTD